MGNEMDFNEAQVKAMLDRSALGKTMKRWICFGGTNIGIKMNWVSALGNLCDALWTDRCLECPHRCPSFSRPS